MDIKDFMKCGREMSVFRMIAWNMDQRLESSIPVLKFQLGHLYTESQIRDYVESLFEWGMLRIVPNQYVQCYIIDPAYSHIIEYIDSLIDDGVKSMINTQTNDRRLTKQPTVWIISEKGLDTLTIRYVCGTIGTALKRWGEVRQEMILRVVDQCETVSVDQGDTWRTSLRGLVNLAPGEVLDGLYPGFDRMEIEP